MRLEKIPDNPESLRLTLERTGFHFHDYGAVINALNRAIAIKTFEKTGGRVKPSETLEHFENIGMLSLMGKLRVKSNAVERVRTDSERRESPAPPDFSVEINAEEVSALHGALNTYANSTEKDAIVMHSDTGACAARILEGGMAERMMGQIEETVDGLVRQPEITKPVGFVWQEG